MEPKPVAVTKPQIKRVSYKNTTISKNGIRQLLEKKRKLKIANSKNKKLNILRERMGLKPKKNITLNIEKTSNSYKVVYKSDGQYYLYLIKESGNIIQHHQLLEEKKTNTFIFETATKCSINSNPLINSLRKLSLGEIQHLYKLQ